MDPRRVDRRARADDHPTEPPPPGLHHAERIHGAQRRVERNKPGGRGEELIAKGIRRLNRQRRRYAELDRGGVLPKRDGAHFCWLGDRGETRRRRVLPRFDPDAESLRLGRASSQNPDCAE